MRSFSKAGSVKDSEKLVEFVNNVFPPGGLSPPRQEVIFSGTSEYGLARSTVKDAVKVLLQRGYLKRKGKRYVASSKYAIGTLVVKEAKGGKVLAVGSKNEFTLQEAEGFLFSPGDEVAVLLRASKRRARTARYLWHVNRQSHYIVGRVRKRKKGYFLEVPGFPHLIPVGSAVKGLKNGDVVRAIIEDRPGGALVHVSELLSRGGGPEAEIRLIVGKAGAPMEHAPDVEEEAEVIAFKAPELPAEDLRDLPFITLDVDDARDHDDAICLIKEGGVFTLYVAIADVSSYVKTGSLLDMEAFNRGFTIYFPGGFFPMLPKKLTHDVLSLQPGVDRNAMVVEIGLTPEGHRLYYSIYPAKIRSRAKLFYGEVTQFLQGISDLKAKELETMLFDMHRLSRRLKDLRRSRGSLDFDLTEQFFVFDGMRLVSIERRGEEEASQIVEEFMLLANETVARHIAEAGVPSIYRVHPPPDQRDLQELSMTLENFGIKMRGELRREDLAGLIDLIRGTRHARFILFSLLRSLKLAFYSAFPGEHFGLALDFYTHFTSPIRRYPDIIVHRVLKNLLDVDPTPPIQENISMEEAADRLSILERRVEEVEREIEKFVSADFMREKVGERFRGFVSGVIEGGVFVELESPFVEGFAPRRLIRGGPFKFDRRKGWLTAKSGRKLAPGTEVEVQLISANPKKRQIDFKIVEIKN